MVTPSAVAEESFRRCPEFSVAVEKRTPSSPPSRRSSQSRLHNFSFPPNLSWGNQRVLRCVNPTVGSTCEIAESAPAPAPTRKRSSSSPDESRRGEEEAESSLAAAERPWNLRTRRAAGNAPREIGRNHRPNPNPNPSSSSSPSPSSPSPLQPEKSSLVKALRSRSEDLEKGAERCKFSIGLSREEIEKDFLAMKGSKPPRRPKKRVKYVQRQLDSLFPGLWLSEITPDLYKIDVEGN